MNVFDIIGPVMIGPSSSHTAGAVRIGKAASSILPGKPVKARILLCGSFAKTYKGHGTDKALIAGILGMLPSDPRIKDSLTLAKEEGLDYVFEEGDIDGAHPNTAAITLTSSTGEELEVVGASVGGGSILINRINGLEVEFRGLNITLIVLHKDTPGMIADVTNLLAGRGVNIGNFKLRRYEKGGTAAMIIEIDGQADEKLNEAIEAIRNVEKSIMLMPY